MRVRISAKDIEAEIARLRDLDLAQLRVEWRKQIRSEPPSFTKRDLLLRALTYELQAKALGGLDRDTVRLLDRLARSSDPRSVLAALQQRRLKPGTLLVREWAGEVHRVMVAENGFVWSGRSYNSLSEIARLITGTRWNGPRFFGLREVDQESTGPRKPRTIAPRRGRPPKPGHAAGRGTEQAGRRVPSP